MLEVPFIYLWVDTYAGCWCSGHQILLDSILAFSLPLFKIFLIASVSFLNSLIFFPIGTISLIKTSLNLFFNSEKFLPLNSFGCITFGVITMSPMGEGMLLPNEIIFLVGNDMVGS